MLLTIDPVKLTFQADNDLTFQCPICGAYLRTNLKDVEWTVKVAKCEGRWKPHELSVSTK